MKASRIPVCTIGALAAVALLSCGASFSGSFYAQGQMYPEMGFGGGSAMVLDGKGWSVTEMSSFDVWPAPADSEWLEIAFALEGMTFAATASFSFVPLVWTSLGLALTADLGSIGLPAQSPSLIVGSSITVGATLDAGVTPYVSLDTTASLGGHYLANSTTLYAHPADVESLFDAYVSIFQTTVGEGDGRLTVSLSAFGETYIVPFEFSYAYLMSKITVGDVSLTGCVTYYGDSTFTLELRLGMSFGPVALCGLGEPVE